MCSAIAGDALGISSGGRLGGAGDGGAPGSRWGGRKMAVSGKRARAAVIPRQAFQKFLLYLTR